MEIIPPPRTDIPRFTFTFTLMIMSDIVLNLLDFFLSFSLAL